MPKYAFITTKLVDPRHDEILQISELIAEIQKLNKPEENIQLLDLEHDTRSWEAPISIEIDPFTYNFSEHFVYKLTGQQNKIWYFSNRDISYLALVALAVQRNALFNPAEGQNGWLLNKHVAVSRTIDRVDHGSRRIYAQTVISDLIGNESVVSEFLNGRTLSSVAAQAQEVFEQLLLQRNTQQCGCIPQHHLFYMVLEDHVVGINSGDYTEKRYFEYFKERLIQRDNLRLQSINDTWNDHWKVCNL